MANELKFTGKIIGVDSIETTKNGFKILNFTVHEERKNEKGDDWGDTATFEIFGEDRINKYKDKLINEAELEIYFNIRSDKYNGRWYTHLSPWKININENSIPQIKPSAVEEFDPTPNEEQSNLPF